MNTFLKNTATVVAVLSLGVNIATVSAQTLETQSALDSVKEKAGNIAETNDSGAGSTGARIETMEKVIDFSISEAKELKAKLAANDNSDAQVIAWRKTMSGKMEDSLSYYETQKEILDLNKDGMSLQALKDYANGFKTWREENFLPAANQIRAFFLIQQEANAIQTAIKRLQKISSDLNKIESSNKISDENIDKLNDFLNSANQKINSADFINTKAREQFWKQYITVTLENDGSQEQTQDGISADSVQQLSIKDLVNNSLVKIKEAYQIFIEMGNLVRKLPR